MYSIGYPEIVDPTFRDAGGRNPENTVYIERITKTNNYIEVFTLGSIYFLRCVGPLIFGMTGDSTMIASPVCNFSIVFSKHICLYNNSSSFSMAFCGALFFSHSPICALVQTSTRDLSWLRATVSDRRECRVPNVFRRNIAQLPYSDLFSLSSTIPIP